MCKYILKNIFSSIILNVHNDPCFEDKSSSLTLKYCPVHFSELNCIRLELKILFNNFTIPNLKLQSPYGWISVMCSTAKYLCILS